MEAEKRTHSMGEFWLDIEGPFAAAGAGEAVTHPRYNLSHQVAAIDEFWSHSWQASSFWKICLLLALKNGRAACVLGTIFACLGAFATHSGLLPTVISKLFPPPYRTPGFHFEHDFAPWALVSGIVAALLTLLLWQPRGLVFVDRACIHQGDARLKAEGIINLGAMLKRSNRLLVVMDRTYLQRLWCAFEISAFLNTHQKDRLASLVILPLGLAKSSLFYVLGSAVLLISDTCAPVEVGVPLRGIGLCTWCIGFSSIFKIYWNELAAVEEMFNNFSWVNLKCCCCELDHKVDGTAIPCDRELIAECVCQWFGSTEAFEECVRTRVRDVFMAQLVHGVPFGYPWALALCIGSLWSQMDQATARASRGDHVSMARALATGVMWWTWILPATYLVYARVSQWVRKSPTCCRQILGFVACFSLFTVPHLFQYYSYEYIAEDNHAFAMLAGTTLLLSLAAFCLLKRSAKQVD
ncbi:hypothetical protein AK812_SmicGene13083 [Symbiodinium microadriaticum]|uniref:TIR domain-containing protein n=1 Tax=Symbiodinium microadriaticum TaxID=2951 RepID=A0A1Q9E914_SYMMI|nr:hypothetical protein AK812_SmicGene13083 [Symbiodinium microadriaticum]